MKNLIVNIFKTLFFFDLAIIVIPLLPVIDKKNPALNKLFTELMVLGVVLILTLICVFLFEKRKVYPPFMKKPIKSFLKGLLCGIAVPGVIIALLAILKHFKFIEFKSVPESYYWILAILCNAIATELMFRGYLFSLYKEHYGFTRTAILTTALYLSLNFELLSKDGVLIANIILLNILLCFLLEFSKSVVTTITTHFVYVLASTFLLGSYPLTGGYPSLIARTFAKKEFYVGTEYPLESSNLMLVVLGFITLIFMIIKYHPIKQAKRLIAYIKGTPERFRTFKRTRKMRRKSFRVER